MILNYKLSSKACKYTELCRLNQITSDENFTTSTQINMVSAITSNLTAFSNFSIK